MKLVNQELQEILEILQGKTGNEDYNLNMVNNVLLEFLNKNQEKFKEFKDDIQEKWLKFIEKNQNRTVKKSFITFFYENFNDFFRHFLRFFSGFSDKSLELNIKEKISDKIIIFEYKYSLTDEVEDFFDSILHKLEGEFYGFTSFLSGYFYFLIRHLGFSIRKSIQKKIFVLLEGFSIKNIDGNNQLHFMVIIKDSKDEIFNSYYKMVLFYFLKRFDGIPEEYFQELLKGRDLLYQIASDEYPSAKEKLVDLLYYFYKKCNILESFSPLLDFFNFVGSRVEDSTFSKVDIINKEFLSNTDYVVEKKNAILKFFDFLDKKSTLYSTFQANNLPSPKSQLNLFFLYMKYYFGSGLEAIEVGDLLFLPKIFKTTLDQYNKHEKDVIGANTIKNINHLLNYLSVLSNIDNIDLFFEKIFKKRISQLNFGFFRTFLKSLNSNFSDEIEKENKILSENPLNTPLTFNIIVDHICRILYVLIDKIFIRKTPDEASKNFIDPRSRYVGKNIALRVLELFVFQDINYSDDVWPDFIISLNKVQLRKEMKKYNVSISNENFYSLEEITNIMVTYNIQSFSDQPFFEEWLINEIIIPLNSLIVHIRNSVRDPKNEIEVYEKLSEFFLSDIEDEKIIREFKSVCQQLASYWKNVE